MGTRHRRPGSLGRSNHPFHGGTAAVEAWPQPPKPAATAGVPLTPRLASPRSVRLQQRTGAPSPSSRRERRCDGFGGHWDGAQRQRVVREAGKSTFAAQRESMSAKARPVASASAQRGDGRLNRTGEVANALGRPSSATQTRLPPSPRLALQRGRPLSAAVKSAASHTAVVSSSTIHTEAQ